VVSGGICGVAAKAREKGKTKFKRISSKGEVKAEKEKSSGGMKASGDRGKCEMRNVEMREDWVPSDVMLGCCFCLLLSFL
jgi:hypothetical protein